MRTVLLALGALAGLVLAGCPAAGDDVRPPSDQFFFPTGLAMAPDERALFVVNANSDLRWDSGAIAVVDLGAVQDLFAAWVDGGEIPGADCEVDATSRHTLICNEAEVVRADAGVRVGNFATSLAVQVLESGALRLFAAVRGDPSITWIDFDGEALACGDEDASFPECDDAHRLTRMRDDPDLFDLPGEPFDIHVDSTDGFAVVTHLSEGAVSLVDAPPDGEAPILSDAIGGLFASNADDPGVRGAAGVAGRLPGSSPDRIYVTSRAEARVQTLTVAWPNGSRRRGGLPVLVPADFFFMNRVLPSDDGRGLAFSADGDRAYVINRDPPTLQIIDTSLNAAGVPRNELSAAIEICQQASNVAVMDSGEGERVYLGCFRTGQVWVIDPAAREVEAIIGVGRGPDGIVASPSNHQVYVTNFLEDTISVIDTRPGLASENRVVLRLGRARQEGGQ
jgi:DNA-binding beta-propeller fold protein YncE